jgi:hypothetical protein
MKDSWINAMQESDKKNPVIFYDSITNLPLFEAPVGRSAEEFILETKLKSG